MKQTLVAATLLLTALAAMAVSPDWGEPVTDNYMMNVYSTVSLDGNQIGTSHGSMLSVWTPEGVMAGKGEPVEAIAGTVQFMFVVFASEPERTGFKLRVYDAATDHIYAVTDEINFINEGAIGTLFEPFAFTAIDEVPQYTVSFDAGEHGTIVGGDSVVTVFENQDAPEPDIEADRPYIFAGWDVDVRNVVRNIYATAVYYKPTGAGTPQNPYRISNAEGLGVASRNPDAHYLLVRNIDLSHLLYREPPIAAQTPFTGSFNGAGRRITGLTIEGAYANGGLFGIIGEEGTVKNLAIEDCSVTGVLNCGALAGINFGSIRRCSSSGTVTDAYSAGGLVGYNYGTIFNSFSTAEVTGIITDTGGLVGVNEGVVSHCYSAKAVRGRGNSRLGGLIGRSERSERNAETTNSFWDVDTSGVSNSAGGKGLSKAEIRNRNTFAEAGWDFELSTEDGTEDDWTMDSDSGMPALARFAGKKPDMNNDGRVDKHELGVVASDWLDCECSAPKWCKGTDVNQDGKVSIADLAALAADWM